MELLLFNVGISGRDQETKVFQTTDKHSGAGRLTRGRYRRSQRLRVVREIGASRLVCKGLESEQLRLCSTVVPGIVRKQPGRSTNRRTCLCALGPWAIVPHPLRTQAIDSLRHTYLELGVPVSFGHNLQIKLFH